MASKRVPKSGIFLGSFWSFFGLVSLASSWPPLGTLLAHCWLPLASLGPPLGPPWPLFGLPLASSWCPLASLWLPFCLSFALPPPFYGLRWSPLACPCFSLAFFGFQMVFQCFSNVFLLLFLWFFNVFSSGFLMCFQRFYNGFLMVSQWCFPIVSSCFRVAL